MVNTKRIAIKVGTQVLSQPNGKLDYDILHHLVQQVALLKRAGFEVILISSGAVGVGKSMIQLTTPEPVITKQIFAAVGQAKLMSTYLTAFSKEKLLCAQVLVTKEDFRDHTHYSNMKNCFENLLAHQVIPVVNENDVVATTELMFTDNDELTSLIAAQLGVGQVVILTNVDGLFNGDPQHAGSQLISTVYLADFSKFRQYIVENKTVLGRGGMTTKFMLAKKLVRKGIAVYFANGKRVNILIDLLLHHKPIGTRFL